MSRLREQGASFREIAKAVVRPPVCWYACCVNNLTVIG